MATDSGMHSFGLRSGLGLVLAATLGLSFKGIFAKFAYADGISVSALLLLRFALAVPLFWVGAFAMRERGAAPLSWRDWRDCSVTGALFFCAAWCDFSALHLLDAGISRIILFTFPGVIMVINAVRERRAPPARQLAGFSVAYSGLLLLLIPDGGTELSAARLEGVLWAFGASVSYAAFWVASQGIITRIGSARFTAASNTATLVLFALVIVPALGPGAWSASAGAAGWVVLIVAICTVAPFFLLFEGIRRSGTAEASVVTLSGPLMTMAAAWVLLGERLSPLQAVGFAVVIAGIGLSKGLVRTPKPRQRAAAELPESAAEGS